LLAEFASLLRGKLTMRLVPRSRKKLAASCRQIGHRATLEEEAGLVLYILGYILAVAEQ